MKIAASIKYVRLQRNIDQETAAEESGISLRTLQNIESGKVGGGATLFAYLDYLGLLMPMLATLPDPSQLTPMEQLRAVPTRRERASKHAAKLRSNQERPSGAERQSGQLIADKKTIDQLSTKKTFKWGDE